MKINFIKKFLIKRILKKEISLLCNKIDVLKKIEQRNKITILNLEQELRNERQSKYLEREKYINILDFYE